MSLSTDLLHPSGQPPVSVNILGIHISSVNVDDALLRVKHLIEGSGKGYVCVTGVHGIMEAQRDDSLRTVLNEAFLSLPDGMPTVWVGHFYGQKQMQRVYGPDFMLALCEQSQKAGHRHFLYGGSEGVAEALHTALLRSYPELKIVGTYTPPFRALDAAEKAALIEQVARVRPDVMWVGLGTPKQERFMYEMLECLDVKVMIGVGAAFDIHTGKVREAPAWIQRSGLQWLHRLVQEPRRLGRRYLVNNPLFVWQICRQMLGGRGRV